MLRNANQYAKTDSNLLTTPRLALQPATIAQMPAAIYCNRHAYKCICILPYIYIFTEIVDTYLRNYVGTCISAGRAKERQPYKQISLETNGIIKVIYIIV